jgi:NAD(P)-dependent dehydrogenase (short-subunit alcohol dehydrogenase family)
MGWEVRGKTVVVTGATSGLGMHAAAEIARRGASLMLIGRDAARTEAAVAMVRAAAPAVTVSSALCDFSSQRAIRALAEELLARLPRIDVLVNNAGSVNDTRRVSEDGIEMTFAVNHLGYYLLTRLLLDRILTSAPARIVSVASGSHYRGTMDFADLGFERGYTILKAYERSKLGNVLFTRELARRLEGKGVTVNCVHPGSVDTNIWSRGPAWAAPILRYVVRPFLLGIEQGADTIVQLVTDPTLDGVNGTYFSKKRPTKPSAIARDGAVAARLWDESAKLVGLPPEI